MKNKKKTHKFLVSSESLNSYGFRVLTEGIEIDQYQKNPIVLFMHNRNTYKPNGDEVVGRAVKVYKEAGNLYADIEFDLKDDFAKKIEGKVSRGFIKMASIGINAIERSTDEQFLIPGQSRPTVTKSKLTEISIVDIGSNDEALKLYDNGTEINLSLIPKLKPSNEPLDANQIGITLGMEGSFTMVDVLANIKQMRADNVRMKKELDTIHEAKVKNLVDTALASGKITHAKYDEYLKMATDNFDVVKGLLDGIQGNKIVLNDFLSGLKKKDSSSNQITTTAPKNKAEWTFFDYFKHEPEALEKDPALKARLLKKEGLLKG